MFGQLTDGLLDWLPSMLILKQDPIVLGVRQFGDTLICGVESKVDKFFEEIFLSTICVIPILALYLFCYLIFALLIHGNNIENLLIYLEII